MKKSCHLNTLGYRKVVCFIVFLALLDFIDFDQNSLFLISQDVKNDHMFFANDGQNVH